MIETKKLWLPLLKTTSVPEMNFLPAQTASLPTEPDELFHLLLYAPQIDSLISDARQADILQELDALLESGYGSSVEQLMLLHRILYQIYTAHFAVPWEHAAINVYHPFILEARRRIERVWDADTLRRYADLLDELPAIDDFAEWSLDLVRTDKSNVFHPLFAFLRDRATREQLSEFLYQETPFDIFFSDILALLLPGVYGALRVELGCNLWDELGKGRAEGMHRNLRLALMEHLGISPRAHLDDLRSYRWEELALANMYLKVALDRSRLGQAIGALLATESAVPGRMEFQLLGWRRVGVPEDVLTYVAEHITVDVKHADGWMEKVVLPLLREHPELLSDIAFGIVSRLDAAGHVCDGMLSHLNVREQ
jgi:hypothetical protein